MKKCVKENIWTFFERTFLEMWRPSVCLDCERRDYGGKGNKQYVKCAVQMCAVRMCAVQMWVKRAMQMYQKLA